MIQEFAVVWAHKEKLIAGLLNTVWLAAVATVLAAVIGAAIAAVLMSRSKPLRSLMRGAVDFMRCIPFLLLAYIVYYGLPVLGIRFDNWSAGLAALILYNSAYMGEILRAAWSGLPAEYTDAAHAFGFYGLRLYRRIILPPVVLAAVPVIGNQAIQVIKDSAFLMIIAVPELTHSASSIQSNYFVPFAAFIAAVALYWVLCRIVELGVGVVERRAEARR